MKNVFIVVVFLFFSCKKKMERNKRQLSQKTSQIKETSTLKYDLKNNQLNDKFVIKGYFDYDDKKNTIFYGLERVNGEPLIHTFLNLGNGKKIDLFIPTGSGYILLKNKQKGCITVDEFVKGANGKNNLEDFYYDNNLSSWFSKVNNENEQASIDYKIIKYDYKNKISNLYSFLNKKFKQQSFYQILCFSKSLKPNFLTFLSENTTKNNVSKINDIGYFFEKSEAYSLSVSILENLTKSFPNRTVAYINLGDAYWGLGNFSKAKQAYKTYIKQMKANRKEAKIPKQVLERVK